MSSGGQLFHVAFNTAQQNDENEKQNGHSLKPRGGMPLGKYKNELKTVENILFNESVTSKAGTKQSLDVLRVNCPFKGKS